MNRTGTILLGSLRRSRAGLLCGTALQAAALSVVALPATSVQAVAQPAPNARPTGGQVVAGSASIAQSAGTTTVSQSSARAAVNWQSFDVGSQQAVVFQQPSASAVTLNRVNSSNPSAIAGRITANGSLVLVNQSGVIFFPGAQVNAAALTVSAAGISNQNFMAGHMVFDAAAKPDAAVVNQGTLTVKQAGLAALVAPRVVNSGVINARLGHVVLAGAEAVTLDTYGDGLVSIDVTKQVTRAPTGADGKPASVLVTNTGAVLADGGTVQITAAAMDGVVQTLVSAGGRIRADSVGARTGTIVIGGTGGALVVEGAVQARGQAAGTMGGQIELATTGSVTLAPSARVNASGRAGGGTVAVGTTLARARGGAGVTPAVTASAVTIARGAKIRADARESGNGGTVALLSTGTTDFAGQITARGGTAGGNGGGVEISGGVVALTGGIDVSARGGSAWRTGSVLLDPTDVLISTNPTPPDANTSVISPGSLEAIVGNVTVQATHDLTVASSVSLTTAGQSMTLDAGHNVTVDAGVTLSANGDIALIAADSSLAATPDGTISFLEGLGTSAATVTTPGLLSLTGGTATMSLSGILNAGAVSLSATGSVSQNMVGPLDTQVHVITAATLSGSVTGSLSLLGPNAIGTLGTVGAATGLAVTNAGDLAVTGTLAAPTIALTSTSGALSLSGTLGNGTLASTSVALAAGTSISQTTGLIDATLLTATAAAGSLSLLGANAIGTLGTVGAATGLAVTNAGDLAVAGPLTAPTIALISTGGALSLSGTLGNGTLASTSVALAAGTSISQTTGLIDATLLTATAAAGSLSLLGANAIGTLGTVGAATGLAVTNAGDLAVAGPLTAPTIALTSTSGALSLGGTLGDGALASTSVTVAAGTSISQTTGLINATLLTANAGTIGTADTVALISLTNTVGTLGASSAAGSFSLVDAAPLTVAGTVSAGSGQTLLLQADTLTLTGATLAAPTGTIVLAPLTNEAISLGSGAADYGVGGIFNAAVLQYGLPGSSTTPTGAIAIDGLLTAGAMATQLLLDSSGSITEVPGGVINVATLGGNAGGSVALTNGNGIGTLGGFTSASGFTLADTGALTVAGTVKDATSITLGSTGLLTEAGTLSAPNIDLTSSGGGLLLTGTLGAGTLASTLIQLSAATSISQTAGVLNTSTLVANAGTVDATDTVSLAGINSIATLTGSAAAGAFTLDDTGPLTVAGTLSAPTIDLSTTGLLTLTGTLDNLAAASTQVTLSGGSISQTAGLIDATTLHSNAGTAATGTVSLTSTANQIGTLSNSSAIAGFTVADTGTLDVVGILSDGASIGLATSGALAVSGTLSAPTIDLTSTAGALSLTGTLGDGALASTLIALQGTAISEAGGVLNTATLVANAGTVGAGDTVSLISGANTIATLTGSSAAGAFTTDDTGPLTVAGTLSAPTIDLVTNGALTLAGTLDSGGTASTLIALTAGTISQTGGLLNTATLEANAGTAATETVSLGSVANVVGMLKVASAGGDFSLSDSAPLTVTGTIAAGNGQTLTLLDDSPTFTGATLRAHLGSILLAPLTPNTPLTLGGAGYASGATLDASVLQLGLPAGSAAPTGAITIAGALAPGVTTLLLESGGAITENAGAVITAATLGGSAGGAVSLPGANAIATLDGFSSVGSLALVDFGSLTVAGPVTVTGTAPHSSVLQLLTSSGIGALTETGTLSAATIDLTSVGGSLALSGSLGDSAGASTVINLVGTSIGQTGGVLNTTTLTVNAGAVSTLDTVSLTSATNTIATLTGSAARGAFSLDDTGPLTVAGTLAAPTITLGTTGSTGALTLTGTLQGVFGAAATLVTLNAATSISQTGGLIDATTLRANAGTLGTADTVSLISATNAIGTLTGASAAGSFTLLDSAPLTVTGTVAAGTGQMLTLLDNAPSVSGATLQAPGGTIVLAPLTANTGFTIGTGGFASGAAFDAAVLQYGLPATATPSVTTPPSGAITIAGTLGVGATVTTLLLESAAAITENAGAVITTPTLGGSAGGTAALGDQTNLDANLIGTLAGFSSVGGFSLHDARTLTTIGTVADATRIALSVSGGDLDVNGTLTTAGTMALNATGNILQSVSGALNAGTLIGSAGGTAEMTLGLDLIGTLGPFSSTTGFALTDRETLTVAGPVSDPTGIFLDVASGDLLLQGVLSSGGSLAATGWQRTGLMTLEAAGSVVQSAGTLAASTLVGSAGGSVVLPTAFNDIATLGGFAAGGNVSLENEGPLAVSGPVSAAGPAGGFDVSLQNAGPIILAGTIGGRNISVIARPLEQNGTLAPSGGNASGSITQTAGLVDAAASAGVGGTLTLAAAGAIAQNGGEIAAVTLTGAAGGSVGLTQAINAIGTLGDFSGDTIAGLSTPGGFALTDDLALRQVGNVSDPDSVTITLVSPPSGGGGGGGPSAPPDLHLGGTLSGGMLDFVTGGTIYQDGGAIIGQTLIGSAAAATIDLLANQVGTLGNFPAPNGFYFTDALSPLTIAGTVTGAPIRLRDDAISFAGTGVLTTGLVSGTVALAPFTAGDTLTIGGLTGPGVASSVTADLLILGGEVDRTIEAAALKLPGSLTLTHVGTLDLLATGDVTEAGKLVMPGGTLIGTGANISLLGGASIVPPTGSSIGTLTGVTNQFGTLGNIAATGGAFTLASTGTQGLTVLGTITAGGTAQTAPSAIYLGATGGGITEAAGGALSAGTLGGWSDVAVSLDTAANRIGTLAGFAAHGTLAGPPGFSLTDAEPLTVAGPVSDPEGIRLTTTSGGIRVQGVLSSGTPVSVGGVPVAGYWQPTPTLTLDSAGGIIESAAGIVSATTLTGTAVGSVALALGVNTIATLSTFGSTGGFGLVGQGTLTVAGPVTDTVSVGLTAAGPIILGGTITAPTIDLTATPLEVNGTVSPDATTGSISQISGLVDATGSSGLLTLNATGAIGQLAGGTEGLTAVTLTGSAGGSVTLSQTLTNAIGTLAGFTAGSTFSLADSLPLTVIGTVQATSQIALTTLGSLDLDALVDGPGGTQTDRAVLQAIGLITQTGAEILAGNLSGSAAAASLDSTGNAISALGPFEAPGGFLLTDTVPLEIVATVTGAPIRLRDDAISFAGTGVLTTGLVPGTVALAPFTAGDTLTVGGLTGPGVASSVTADVLVLGGEVNRTIEAAALALPGQLTLTGIGTLDLLASGDIIQTGTIVMPHGTLIGTARDASLLGSAVLVPPGASGQGTLTGVTNQFGTLGVFTATGGSLALASTGTQGLTLLGAVTAGGTTQAAPSAITFEVTDGGITEAAGGVLAAGTLGGWSDFGVTLASAANRIGTLAGFSADATLGGAPGFTLLDSKALTVAGPLSDPSGILLHTTSGDIRIQGVVSGGTLVSVSGVPVAGYWQPTPTLTLDSAGGIIESAAGTISATTLTGTAAGGVALALGVNTITMLGSFGSTGGLVLVDQGALTVTGPVADTASVSLTTAGPITLNGDITAPTIALSATPLEMNGTVSPDAATGSIVQIFGTADATGPVGSLTLDATGAIAQFTGGTEALAAVTLTGSAGGDVTLSQTLTNAIGTVAGFTAGSTFALADSHALTVIGTVQAPSQIALTTLGSLDLDALLDGSGGSQTGSAVLRAGGAISQTGGAILAGNLSGGGTAASLDSTGNAIDTLGTFAAPGGFRLTDSQPLEIAGMVTGAPIRLRDDAVTFAADSLLSAPGGTVALAPYAAGDSLSVTGSGGPSIVTANTLIIGADLGATPQAGTLTLGGTLNLAGAPLVDLLATGDITQTGALLQPTGTLIGSGADVLLTGAGNMLGTLGGFAATGAFALDNAGAGLTVTGTLQAGTSLALGVIGGGITLGTAGAAGALVAPALVALTADGAITEPNGVIDAGTLTLAGASAALGGGNAIGTLAAATAPGGLSLNDTTGLAVSGPVSAGPVAFTVAGDLILAGDVTAPSVALSVMGAVVQQAGSLVATTLSGAAASLSLGDLNSIATLGPLTLGGSLVLNDAPDLILIGGLTAGAVQLTDGGRVLLAGDVTATSLQVTAAGSLTQTAGTLTTGLLTGSAAAIALPDANRIASLGSLVSRGTLLLDDVTDVALTGGLTAAGAVTLVTSGALTEAGAGGIVTPSLSGSAAAADLQGDNMIPTIAGFAAPGGLVFSDFVNLGITGPVAAGTVVLDVQGNLALATMLSAGATTLTTSGAITQSGGGIVGDTLSGSAASASFIGANNVVTLAGFASTGALTLNTAGALDVTGPVTAATASLTVGGAVALNGNISADSLQLSVGGSVVQQAGVLTVGTLGGTAANLVQLGPDAAGPVASVGTLGPITVSGAGSQLYLADSVPLVLLPPITAGAISISAPSAITLLAGTVVTGGVPTVGPSQPISVVTQTGTVSVAGSTLTTTGEGGQFRQTGTTVVTPPPGQATGTLIVQVSGAAATINLANLVAPAINLVLASGAGQSSGLIDVASLTIDGLGGSADLAGTVGGYGGKVAARVSTITPAASRNYQINACPLQSVNCLVISIQSVPIPSVLSDLEIGNVTDNTQDPDLLLPNIAAKDY